LDILLIVFIGLVALALLGQWAVMIGLARRLRVLGDRVTPLLPKLEQTVAAVGPLVSEAQALLAETRPKLRAVTQDVLEVSAQLKEISTTARDGVRRAEVFASDMGQRVELQMVRLDEALGAALASVDQISTTVRDTVLRPVQDAQALFQGVRTGLDFFFRRRPSPASPRPSAYQDEEMFI